MAHHINNLASSLKAKRLSIFQVSCSFIAF